jgi:hypothetical protein
MDMIFNVTRTDRNIDRAVNEALGKRFGLLHKLTNGSIGSEPFIIETCSPDFEIDLENQDYERKCNIELRPRGIIVHYRKKSSSFIWVIPYHHLAVYQSGNQLSIYGNTVYVKLRPRMKRKKSSPFIKKMIAAKTDFSLTYDFQ